MEVQKLRFERDSIILFLFSICGSGFNYLFQIVSGRLLTPEQYGDLNSLFSVFNIATVLGTSLALSVARIIAEENKNATEYINKMSVCTGGIACGLILVQFICLHWLMGFTVITSIVTSISVAITVFSYIYYGALQGRKMFMSVGVMGFIPPVVKMILGSVLLYVFIIFFDKQNPVNAVFISIAFSAVITSFWGRKKLLENEIHNEGYVSQGLVKSTFSFLKFGLISSICLVVFNNFDVLIVRHFFDDKMVGMYSSALLFGKIILYIPSALVTVMIPNVAENKANKTILKKSLLYSIGLSLTASVCVFVLKDFMLPLLMGEKYVEATKFILPICLMINPLVVVTVVINYLLASGKEAFVSLCCVVSVLLTIGLVSVFNSTINEILVSIAFVCVALFIVLLSKILLSKDNKVKVI